MADAALWLRDVVINADKWNETERFWDVDVQKNWESLMESEEN